VGQDLLRARHAIGEAVEGRVHGRYRAGPQQKMIALDHSCRRTVFRFLGAKVF
jgi:hypothetical protein